MPNMYLAKINLNSNIFDVYNKSLKIENVCDAIFERFSENITYSKQRKIKVEDSLGNTKSIFKTEVYTLQEMEKNDEEKVITGYLMRSFTKPTEALENNKIVKKYNEENTSILFYYDVDKELIAFCERQSFGYNQFMNAIKHLLDTAVQEYTFEIFLKKDKNELEKKIKQLKTVTKIKADLIPPNANEDDLQKLRKSLMYTEPCQDANANRMKIEYCSDAMNLESDAMKGIFESVSLGYGDVTATGINQNGKTQTINSSQDAPHIIKINDNLSKKDFFKEAITFIAGLFM